ncbi:hypothetical protein AOQ84DRAFT_373600 [Glonium stellatum]|uniref:Heterokaryon incompatibility domain-containing protein n=1 Tax=Glonium stellatum TaxID=574774 RepID=A0A8E2F8F1_9PEZI|nr:hypothetical protein AOQ84DRAFT_373600 [Glonium stellatum]
MRIPENLRDAHQDVCFLNPDEGKRVIWADAVYTNQDVKECNGRVQMMGQIFRDAQKVITYIRKATPDAELGIRFASYLRKFAELLCPERFEPWKTLLSKNLPSWIALRELLTASCFSRTSILWEPIPNDNILMY